VKTQFYVAAILDGYIADRRNSLDWLFAVGDLESSSYPEFIAEVGAIAMGSTTYQWLLDNEIYPPSGETKPWMYEQPTWVFTSRSLRVIPGADIRFVSGDVRPVHEEMVAAAEGKNIWIAGGGELVGQFYDQGLLDELIVQIAPVTLGGGAPLLPREIVSPPLQLDSMERFGSMAELRFTVQKGRIQDSEIS
jgi:dihydrofolate reductase